MTSAVDTVTRVAPVIQDIGAKWMLHPDTFGYGAELGYPGPWPFYFAGRGGVLGPVEADLVMAAFGFFDPGLTSKMWDRGTGFRAGLPAAADFTEACARFGRKYLAELDEQRLARAAELAEKVEVAADVAGLTLFAGWRLMPKADDPRGRVLQSLNVLRELRGSLHLCAVVAAGMSPVEAIITQKGEGRARDMGFRDALPDAPEELRTRRGEVERATDAREAPVYERALNEAERAEFADLVEEIGAAVTVVK